MKLYIILFHFHHSTSRMEENVDEAKQIEDFRLNSVDPEGIRRSLISNIS